MFFMGEEIGATKPFTTDHFSTNKEDLIGDRNGDGRFLFAFYKALIGLVLSNPAARSTSIDVIYRHNDNRVIAFTRSAPTQNLLIIASLSDSPLPPSLQRTRRALSSEHIWAQPLPPWESALPTSGTSLVAPRRQ